MKKLSIVIPVHNNSHFTKMAIKDLLHLGGDHEIIVVDNGSTDDTEAVIEEMWELADNPDFIAEDCNPNITYKVFSENHGFAVGSNAGYIEATAPNVLFLNNDIKVKKSFHNWTKDIIKYAEEGYLVAAEAGLLNRDFNFVKEGNSVSLRNPLSYLSGWCLGGSVKTFNKLILGHCRDLANTDQVLEMRACGPWNELFFPAYFEDGDLSFRAREQDIPMKTIKVPVHHFGRMTGKKLNMREVFLDSRKKFINLWKNKV
jgi:GT2 family glycosyltransferase